MRTLMIYLICCLWVGTMCAHGKIAFNSTRNGRSDIYVMNSDGTGQTRLTHNEASDTEAAWSPNGRQIAFSSDRDGNEEIYMMDADGGNQRNLTHHPALDGSPAWSPDGSQIAFTSDRVNNGLSLFVMDADGANVRQLTEGWFDVVPKWSPDGKRIAFEAMLGLGHGRQIYVMNADGTNRWQVSEPIPQAGMFMMGWSPDGKKILYTAAVDHLVMKSSLIIATLHPRRHEAIRHERVPLPKNMHINTAAWGADGKSVLFGGRKKEADPWDVFRFRLHDEQLINLTNNRSNDSTPHEWNSRLSVSPRRLAPKRWGEIKSNSHRHRGRGGISTPPVP